MWHRIQTSEFVPQFTLTDFAESYIRKSIIERAPHCGKYVNYPHCIAGVLKYPRSQIGAMPEARSNCALNRKVDVIMRRPNCFIPFLFRAALGSEKKLCDKIGRDKKKMIQNSGAKE